MVYKRYASLYFVAGIEEGDNELITLEVIHHFVEVLDRYFGNVCELDLIFNFHKVSGHWRGPMPATQGGATCLCAGDHIRCNTAVGMASSLLY